MPGFRSTDLALLAFLLFGFIAVAFDMLYEGPLTMLEQEIALAIDYRTFPELAPVMLMVTYFGSTAFASVSAGIVAAALLFRRAYRAAFMLIAAVYGGMLLNATLKQIFQRARPVVENPLLVIETFSFPSGHAAVATVLYGAMAVLAARRLRERRSRAVAIAFAALLVVVIGTSRVYLGVHHLTDVVAGVIEAVFWLLICHILAYRTRGARAAR
jgi:undecaprenyl-diphosphatase